jgi:hypothetical protein
LLSRPALLSASEVVMRETDDQPASRIQRRNRVTQRIRSARDNLPGERNDLTAGALGGVPVDPQGDENREPPPNAPTIPP